MKLLIVDDSAMIRRAVSTAYKSTVFTDVQTAADGLLALTAFKQQLPDVVTLDITMPYMDGLAALTQMLEIKPNTIVLVISALADNHTAIEALVRGAHQFICKPFTSDDLKEALDTLLKDHGKIQKTEITQKNNESRAYSEQLEQRLERLSQDNSTSTNDSMKQHPPTQEKPPSEHYPSGYVQPPSIQIGENHNQLDQPAVSRQMSVRDNFFSNNNDHHLV